MQLFNDSFTQWLDHLTGLPFFPISLLMGNRGRSLVEANDKGLVIKDNTRPLHWMPQKTIGFASRISMGARIEGSACVADVGKPRSRMIGTPLM